MDICTFSCYWSLAVDYNLDDYSCSAGKIVVEAVEADGVVVCVCDVTGDGDARLEDGVQVQECFRFYLLSQHQHSMS